jgi:glycosyltransferase involved in cell wall biosynthesis
VGRGFAWPGVLHRCYRNSALFSVGVASLNAVHRLAGTWDNLIDRYIVFTGFYKRLFMEAGLPEAKLTIKPHFLLPDPGQRDARVRGGYVLYVGRLEPEKGSRTLLSAWRQVGAIPLLVRGDGDLLPEYVAAEDLRSTGKLTIVGKLPIDELYRLLKRARFLIWPSEGFYETFGNVAMEAMACGVPIVASRAGVCAEIVQEHKTGLLFQPSSATDLAATAEWAWNNPDCMAEFGVTARRQFEERFTADENYHQLRRIYAEVGASASHTVSEPAVVGA